MFRAKTSQIEIVFIFMCYARVPRRAHSLKHHGSLHKNSRTMAKENDYFSRLTTQIKQLHPQSAQFFEVIDKPFESRLRKWLKERQVDFVIHRSPGFLLSENDFS